VAAAVEQCSAAVAAVAAVVLEAGLPAAAVVAPGEDQVAVAADNFFNRF